jgi:hypothetical protein
MARLGEAPGPPLRDCPERENMHVFQYRLAVLHARTAEENTMSKLEYALPAKSGDIASQKSRMAGLLVACPVTQDNPYDCPLKSVRQLPLRERYRWLDTLRPDQMRGFLKQHNDCIVRKEQENHEPA